MFFPSDPLIRSLTLPLYFNRILGSFYYSCAYIYIYIHIYTSHYRLSHRPHPHSYTTQPIYRTCFWTAAYTPHILTVMHILTTDTLFNLIMSAGTNNTLFLSMHSHINSAHTHTYTHHTHCLSLNHPPPSSLTHTANQDIFTQ